MGNNIDEYSLDELLASLWCVVDTVTGLTHIGVLEVDEVDSMIVLQCPRCIVEREDTTQVILTHPMYIGCPNGTLKLSSNTTNVQFRPCTEVIDAYLKSLLREREEVDINTHTIETIQ